MREYVMLYKNKLLNMGFFHIVSSNILKNLLVFLAGIIIIRVIEKNDYGAYIYANNILSYFMLFSGLGITSAVFQICCENQNRPKYALGIFSYGAKCGYVINIMISLLILTYAFLGGGMFESSRSYLLVMSFLPVLSIGYNLATVYFRYKLENIVYSYIVMIYAVCSCLSMIVGAYYFGAWGLIISNYLAPLVCILFSKRSGFYFSKEVINIQREIKIDIWKLAIMSMMTNAISNIMYMIDISMIGEYIQDEEAIASYKVATTLPTSMLFISSSVVTFIYPHFAAHINDVSWTIKNVKKIMIAMSIFFFVICTFFIFYAEVIMTLVFGKQYADAVYIFQILMAGLFFQGTFRIIIGNLLVAQRAIGFNLIESVLSGIINILADYYLIFEYKVPGIAFATVLVMIFSSSIITLYYGYLLRQKSKHFD